MSIMFPRLNADLTSDIKIINENGVTGNVFVAYRPGLSSFQKDVTHKFIKGLEGNDWRIDRTTISSETPIDLSFYDLTVFGSPTYGGEPHDSVVEYFDRGVDLNQTEVVIIVTSMASKAAASRLENMVINANGTVVESLIYHVFDLKAKEKSYNAGLRYN